MSNESKPSSRSGRYVQVPLELAQFVRKVFLPANPNKLRTAAPETIAYAHEFIGLVSDGTYGRAAAAVSEQRECAWHLDGEDSDTFATACGHFYVYSDGTLKECEAYYCQGCGGKITLPYER